MKRTISFALLILSLGLLVFFFRLGSIPLLDPDEPRYAESAREMMESGDTINPQLNGENRWDKPVLFYWAILWSYKIYGISEWAARFPSALLALVTILAGFFWAKRQGDSLWGLWASLILMTNIEFCVVGRLAITDMMLSFFQTLALILAFESWRTHSFRTIFFVYIAAAFAFLTKGPIGLLLPGLIFLIFLSLSRDFYYLKRARLAAGMTIFCAIALPWYLIEGFLYKDFFRYFFVLHNVKRFATNELRHNEPFFYYIGIIAVGFLPWSLFVPRALGKAFRNLWKEPINLYLTVWFLMGLLFFSISHAKLPTYILSIFFPLSFLVARFLGDVLKEPARAQLRVEGFVLAILSLGVWGAGSFFWSTKVSNEFLLFLYAVMPAFLGFFVSALWLLKRRFSVAFAGLAVSFVVGFLSILYFLGPEFGKIRSMKEIALKIRSENKSQHQIASFGFPKPSLVFYMGCPIHKINTLAEFESFMKGPLRAYCVMRKDDYLELNIQTLYPKMLLTQDAYGKVVISNNI